jgi:protein gp37
MATKTGIEWTDTTWNPIRGCSRVSEGCRNCYAEKMACRFCGEGKPYEGLVRFDGNGKALGWNGKIYFAENRLLDPLKWGQVTDTIEIPGESLIAHRLRSRRIFVNSTSDLFHEGITDEMRDRIFAVMALSPQHTFQILTKRPARMLAYLNAPDVEARVARACVVDGHPLASGYFQMSEGDDLYEVSGSVRHLEFVDEIENGMASVKVAEWRAADFDWWPLPNVWLGVSVENQAAADERIPLLIQTPAAKRFISAEPLLGSIDLDSELSDGMHAMGCGGGHDCGCGATGLDWVICGGESGPGARPMHPDWARGLRDQCVAAGVPFFFKQWGEWSSNLHLYGRSPVMVGTDGDVLTFPFQGSAVIDSQYVRMQRVGKKAAWRLLDGREWDEFPEVR